MDAKKHDGSYEVVPPSDLLPFFVNLKNFIDGFLKSEEKSKITLSGKDDFINILCHFATSKDLKILWCTVLTK